MPQFTLNRLMMSTACLACACAISGFVYRNLFSSPLSMGSMVLLFWSLLAIGGLSGAAIGNLAGRVGTGVIIGMVLALVAAMAFFAVILPMPR